ncbi:DUF4893 domain-containing protein [Pseudaminobacter manganicus]|uniref:DUF4893 domain-containing protein n=2 Tax=Manganibacter manganicus TaxID=1873176 RepID=A0A1V8RWV0_9HYPH|nr:DUF4893 domain-containing protein [Pseudaminobacter manganicus]OQM77660.1 DUF4893 domain-containing protein [Pseudaminobacter manganicus]
MHPSALALVLLAVAIPSYALADGVVQKRMTPADKTRLENYEQTREAALKEAEAGDPAAIRTLDTVLSKPPVAFSDQDLTGNWRCRTIKIGGDTKLIVYDWFKCRVTDDGSGWQLTKSTGSQRTEGRLYDDGEKRAIYLGSFHVADEPIKPYGSGPKTDQVGYAFRSGPDKWRIEFPAPYYESKLDILELTR